MVLLSPEDSPQLAKIIVKERVISRFPKLRSYRGILRFLWAGNVSWEQGSYLKHEEANSCTVSDKEFTGWLWVRIPMCVEQAEYC